jgi:cysteine desulfurase
MGFDPERARGSLRVTLGRFSTDDEVNRFLEILPRVLASLKPAVNCSKQALIVEIGETRAAG